MVGFGEVGQTLSADLSPQNNTSICAWDLLFVDPTSGPSKASTNIRIGESAQDAAQDADLVISAVTAARTLSAAQSVAGGMKPSAFFLDLNSASPGVKEISASIINQAGGRYVEAALMSPIEPKRIAAPILLGGPHAEVFLPLAHQLGFSGTRVFSRAYGMASAAKMCRSVVIKGVEALLSEALLSARHYGVEETVVASLSDLFPGPDWETLSHYMISRALKHGTRRAEEMREVAKTVEEAGLSPLMSSACAERQGLSAAFAYALESKSLPDMLDAILDARSAEKRL